MASLTRQASQKSWLGFWPFIFTVMFESVTPFSFASLTRLDTHSFIVRPITEYSQAPEIELVYVIM